MLGVLHTTTRYAARKYDATGSLSSTNDSAESPTLIRFGFHQKRLANTAVKQVAYFANYS